MALISILYGLTLLPYAALTWPTQEYPTQLIYQTAKGVWYENLAVRPGGSVLTTLLTSPELYLIQPSPAHPDPQLVHRFDGSTSLLGITEETNPDTFQVVACNYSIDAGVAAPNSSKLYRVQFNDRHHPNSYPEVTLTTELPAVNFPNGLTTLNDHVVLLADSALGNVVAIDVKTGAYQVVVSDPLLKPNANLGIGVNGVKVHHGYSAHGISTTTLYFTNSAQDILGSVPIDGKTGKALKPATIVTHGLASQPGEPSLASYDDFALSADGRSAFLASIGGNVISKVEIATGKQRIIAGNLNSTEIAQPTAAQFGSGDKSGVLYVTTAGGLKVPVNGNEVVGAQLLAIDIGEKH